MLINDARSIPFSIRLNACYKFYFPSEQLTFIEKMEEARNQSMNFTKLAPIHPVSSPNDFLRASSSCLSAFFDNFVLSEEQNGAAAMREKGFRRVHQVDP